MATATAAEFERVVRLHHQALYRLAFCLSRSPTDAENLVGATFQLWAGKQDSPTGGGSGELEKKEKLWLFAALCRHFVETRRSHARFPHFMLAADREAGLPAATSPAAAAASPRNGPDATTILRVLTTLDEIFQAPLTLFFLEDFSFAEIAEILETPLSTVRSRIARGKTRLHERLTVGATTTHAGGAR